jgi:hypothetical protein
MRFLVGHGAEVESGQNTSDVASTGGALYNRICPLEMSTTADVSETMPLPKSSYASVSSSARSLVSLTNSNPREFLSPSVTRRSMGAALQAKLYF